MKKILLLVSLVLLFLSAKGQNWTLIDTGAGLIIADSNNTRLKIVWRSSVWDARDLHENGALEGKYKGNQLFAAWIQGPETKEYLNSKGIPVWMYRYKITCPDGKTIESELHDFFTPGFSYLAIDLGTYTEGVWKIEWFIHNRDTGQSSAVATTLFQTTWGKQGKKPVESFKAKSDQEQR